MAGSAYFAMHNPGRHGRFWLTGDKMMTRAIAAFGIAVAGTSLICYALMTRAENIKCKRRSSGDNATDGGSSGSDGWFGVEHSTTDCSGNPSDFSAGDSGDGDSGGGDGGDGGGSGD